MLNRLLLTGLSVATLAFTGCGDDAPATDAAATPPATKTESSAETQSPAATEVEDGAITVTGTEMKFTPSVLHAAAGKLTITLKNGGTMEHELVVLKTDAAAGSLPVKDGQVSEDASVGEIAEVEAGKSASHTFDLKPGKYVIVCNVPGHYAAGMRGTLVVD